VLSRTGLAAIYAPSMPWAVVIVAALLPPLALFLILGHRHDIDAGQPAMKVDVGAALRAERMQRGIRGLAANRARARTARSRLGCGHERNMGRAACGASVRRC